uniref:Uncharacterized protein n=1 Tax=Panagrolaimus sp. PS1159 TaxID=55785 RepID=A0AC35GH01_9BILA
MELERRQLYRKVVENVRGKDFSSSQAVGMLNQAIAEKRMNPAERQQFNRSMPSTRSLKRMLRRATAPANYPADFGMESIPQELQNSPFEHQAYNTTPDYDGEAVQMPLPIIPPMRPQLQNQNQHFGNPNLFQNPFIEAQQQQNFMNHQMQMLMLQQQQMAQQQMAHFQWQQMLLQNRFRFP